ncbi:hypothetical protein C8Q72DRAFT_827875 [Fomitopsis betulina]|nr:hypothetical protein C8Q72DRAFT_827875 [Fomitopsis betulina]
MLAATTPVFSPCTHPQCSMATQPLHEDPSITNDSEVQNSWNESASTGSSAVSDDAQSSIGRIPPFHPSESANPQMSPHLRQMLQVPEKYTMTPRPLFLGWRTPSKRTERAFYNIYKEKYGLDCIRKNDHVVRFALLLERHLQCPEITPARCLFKDVVYPDPVEIDRSFDCISIATTWQHRHCSGPKLTDDQFRWLVQYFGGLPAWYYHFLPTYDESCTPSQY